MTSEGATAKARRLVPLYDASAPIVCTIGDDERADRIALVERVRDAMTQVERTASGLLLTFPRTDAVEADVRRFVVDEKRCCQFWGFAVVDGDDELVLRWDAPAGATQLLERIEAVLRSDVPIDRIGGLL